MGDVLGLVGIQSICSLVPVEKEKYVRGNNRLVGQREIRGMVSKGPGVQCRPGMLRNPEQSFDMIKPPKTDCFCPPVASKRTTRLSIYTTLRVEHLQREHERGFLQLQIQKQRLQKLAARYQHATTLSKQQGKGGVSEPSC